jgi:hypothetical protein
LAKAGSSPAASGIPNPNNRIQKVVNPQGEKPYAGPTGSVRGRVSITGDQAPSLDELVARIPPKCAGARVAYAKLFREGMMRSLADALVAVTEYRGYVPETNPVVQVEARDCAWSTRTVALTFGQRLEVVNRSSDTYVPELQGARMPAQLVAVPHGDPVPLYPGQPGRYVLTDTVKDFMFAEVLVLKYPTHTVTGLDGAYEIRGVPVGKVSVSAFLPTIMQSISKQTVVEPNKASVVDLEIAYDAKKHPPQVPTIRSAVQREQDRRAAQADAGAQTYRPSGAPSPGRSSVGKGP